MFIFYILFLLVIAYFFALKATYKIVSWLPWLLLTVFVLSIFNFVIDHWIISIIIVFVAATIFGMTIETEEDGKTIKPEPENLKFYQRKVFKGWIGFIAFFTVMVGLANGPFAKHSDHHEGKKETVVHHSSSSKAESSSVSSSSYKKTVSDKKPSLEQANKTSRTYDDTNALANGQNFNDDDYRNPANIGKSIHLTSAVIGRVDKKDAGLWIQTINDDNNVNTTNVQAANLSYYNFKEGDIVDIKATLQGMKKSMVTFNGDTDMYPTIWITDINIAK